LTRRGANGHNDGNRTGRNPRGHARVDLDRNPAQLDKLRDQVTELTRRVAERQRTDNVTPD